MKSFKQIFFKWTGYFVLSLMAFFSFSFHLISLTIWYNFVLYSDCDNSNIWCHWESVSWLPYTYVFSSVWWFWTVCSYFPFLNLWTSWQPELMMLSSRKDLCDRPETTWWNFKDPDLIKKFWVHIPCFGVGPSLYLHISVSGFEANTYFLHWLQLNVFLDFFFPFGKISYFELTQKCINNNYLSRN